MGWPGDVLHDPRRAGAQQRAGRLIFHGPATSMASGPSPTSGRHARQMTASTQSGWSRPCKSSSASIPPPARSRRSSSSPSTLHRGVRGAGLVPVSPSQPRANGLGAPLAVQTTTTSRAVAYGFRSPSRCLRALRTSSTTRSRWTTTKSGGGDFCFLAKELSWRTSSGVRTLLSWTNLSSGRHHAREPPVLLSTMRASQPVRSSRPLSRPVEIWAGSAGRKVDHFRGVRGGRRGGEPVGRAGAALGARGRRRGRRRGVGGRGRGL